MKRTWARVALILCISGLSLWARADFRHKVDPKIQVWLSCPQLRALAGADPAAATASRAPVLIRFHRRPSAARLRRLGQQGVTFRASGPDRAPLHLGLFFAAHATTRGLAALARSADVRQVDLDALVNRTPPLDVTAREVGATAVWPRQIKGVPLTGKGMLVGNIDAGIDVFHPAFFKADGGVYSWIDVNKNGAFDAGTDAVDLDRDGKAGSGETLGFIDVAAYNKKGQLLPGTGSNAFEPGLDWLYVDKNGNNKRDSGAQNGFSDKDHTFGEQLFVAEDLDGDGQLDLAEQLVALKTSKIRATNDGTDVRTRGKDLTQTAPGRVVSHGMATSGVLVGGQRGFNRWVGLAPGAEMMMGITGTSLSAMVIWLHKAKVHVMLHEYAPWTGYHLDGSSNHEQMMDQSATAGVPQVTPAGNLGGADKHMRVEVKPGATVQVPFVVPAPSYKGIHYYMNMTLLWRDPKTDLALSLKDPQGRTHALESANTFGKQWGDGQTKYYSYRTDSSRNTAMINAILSAGTSSTPATIPTGTWTLVIKHPKASGAKITVLGYLYDGISRWGKGIAFTTHASELGIICWPATADSAITLAAYAGHVGAPHEYPATTDKVGDLRRYSGRGVRIDGKQIMDIAAPDNPLVPSDKGHGVFRVFGGTSGAGPHVAAAALLIKQHSPTLDGLAVRAALRKGALVDAQVGSAPNDRWGAGKLRVYRSIYGKDPVANTAPTAAIQLQGQAVWVGKAATFRPLVADKQDAQAALKVRWDEGYDGTWDTSDDAVKDHSVTFSKAGPARIKLQVTDSGGLTGAAALLLQVLPAGATPDLGAREAGATDAAADARADGGGQQDQDDGCGCGLAGAGQGSLLALLLLLALARRTGGW